MVSAGPDGDRSLALPKSKRMLSFASALHRTAAGHQQSKDHASRSTTDNAAGGLADIPDLMEVQHHLRLLLRLQSHTDGNAELTDLADCQQGEAEERGIR